MRKFLNILVLACIIATSFTACNNNEGEVDVADIELDPQALTFRWLGGDRAITVPDAANITAIPSDEWIHTTVADNTVNITVDALATQDTPARNGSIVIETATGRGTLSINQNAAMLSDKLEGKWASSQYFAMGIDILKENGMMARNGEEMRIVTITYVNDTTVQISDFMGLAHYFQDATSEQDTVLASVDNENGTISIVSQKLTPTFDGQGYDTYFCRLLNDIYTYPDGKIYNNWGVGFDNIPVVLEHPETGSMIIDLYTGGLDMGLLYDVQTYGAITILSKDDVIPYKAYWYTVYTTDTWWEKLPDDFIEPQATLSSAPQKRLLSDFRHSIDTKDRPM